jgi:hypothetical protein
MSSSSGVGNGVCGRGIVRHRGGCGGHGIGRAGLGGCGGVLEDSLPLRSGLHFHCEITLPMGDSGRVANVVIGIEINLLYIELFSFDTENL